MFQIKIIASNDFFVIFKVVCVNRNHKNKIYYSYILRMTNIARHI